MVCMTSIHIPCSLLTSFILLATCKPEVSFVVTMATYVRPSFCNMVATTCKNTKDNLILSSAFILKLTYQDVTSCSEVCFGFDDI